MIKKSVFYISILLTVAFISAGFKPYKSQSTNGFHLKEIEQASYIFPSQNYIDYANLKIPFLGKYFVGFREAVAHKESQGEYKKNQYFGIYGQVSIWCRNLKIYWN